MTLSQSLTEMARDLDSMTEGAEGTEGTAGTLRTTGGTKLSARQKRLKFCSAPMKVVTTRVGGLSGVRIKQF